jgi:hypothetical protein
MITHDCIFSSPIREPRFAALSEKSQVAGLVWSHDSAALFAVDRRDVSRVGAAARKSLYVNSAVALFLDQSVIGGGAHGPGNS